MILAAQIQERLERHRRYIAFRRSPLARLLPARLRRALFYR